MNKFFGEIPTALARTAAVDALDHQRIAVIFATGETRAAELEICPMPDSSQVALSARLERLGDNPKDGLIQYLTQEGVAGIQPDTQARAVGAHLSLSLVNA